MTTPDDETGPKVGIEPGSEKTGRGAADGPDSTESPVTSDETRYLIDEQGNVLPADYLEEPPLNPAELVAAIVRHPELLDELVGANVVHYRLGKGLVESAEDEAALVIRFDEGVRTFPIGYLEHPDVFPSVEVLRAGLIGLYISRDGYIDLLRSESEAEWADLKGRYGVSSLSDTSESPLHLVLLKAERNETLNDAEYAYLQERRLLDLFADLALREALQTGNGGRLARRCGELRELRAPELVLRITAEALSAGVSDRHMLLTTRGGALRNLARPEEAERCGLEAASLNPGGYHPHMLLGAAYFDMQAYGKGERHFAEAERLGANREVVERQMRAAMEKQLEPQDTARYLLERDPDKYAWAAEFLDPKRTRIDPWKRQKHGKK